MPTLSRYQDRFAIYFYYLVLVAETLVVPSATFAQGSGSSLSGLITDNSQAVVPAAMVKARPQWTGPSDFDTPQRVAFSYVYELPAGRNHQLFSHGLAAYVLGNWRTSGVYTFSSGLPFTVWSGSALTTALDPNGASDPVNTAVPNVIGQAHIVGNVNCWFYASQNPACDALAPNCTDAFQLRAPGQFGDSGRNSLRGPHTNVFDFALLKDFAIRENKTLQFRWEIFNLFNTPIFGPPNTDFSSGAAGQITTLAGDPRVMQFALRQSF